VRILVMLISACSDQPEWNLSEGIFQNDYLTQILQKIYTCKSLNHLYGFVNFTSLRPAPDLMRAFCSLSALK
jgi:hypothetical protein